MSNGPINLSELVATHRKTKIVVRATTSNRASLMGSPCTRKIVYERTKWQEKKLHDEGLQAIFDGGNALEDVALQDIKDSGVRVIQQQRDLALPAFEITGHIDAALDVDGHIYPIDVKSMSPQIWKSVAVPEDFFNHKFDHVRAYPAQILLYTYMMASDWGVLYCLNKSTFQTKDIWFKVADYMDVIDAMKEKALEVTKHVKEGTLPDRIDDLTVCAKCPYSHICLPDKDFGPGVQILEDAEFLAMLDRWYATKAIGEEHNTLDEDIKEVFKKLTSDAPSLGKKGEPKASDGHKDEKASPSSRPSVFAAGQFVITVTDQKRKKWEVDENLKKMVGEVKETTAKIVKIERRDEVR